MELFYYSLVSESLVKLYVGSAKPIHSLRHVEIYAPQLVFQTEERGISLVPFQLTLPYYNHVPSLPLEQLFVYPIAFRITVQLYRPVISLCFWHHEIRAIMHMPETAIDEYDSLVSRKHYIWFSGISVIVFPISKSPGE